MGFPGPGPQVEVGDIVQIRPDWENEAFKSCLVTVTEVKSFGVQGYVQNAGTEGQAYIRLKWDDFENTGGKACWMVK